MLQKPTRPLNEFPSAPLGATTPPNWTPIFGEPGVRALGRDQEAERRYVAARLPFDPYEKTVQPQVAGGVARSAAGPEDEQKLCSVLF